MSVDTRVLNFVDHETPTPVGGSQLALQHAPSPADSLQFFRNGVLQSPGADYAAAGFFILLNAPAADGDTFTAFYRF